MNIYLTDHAIDRVSERYSTFGKKKIHKLAVKAYKKGIDVDHGLIPILLKTNRVKEKCVYKAYGKKIFIFESIRKGHVRLISTYRIKM